VQKHKENKNTHKDKNTKMQLDVSTGYDTIIDIQTLTMCIIVVLITFKTTYKLIICLYDMMCI